jgi:hypothetical protein
VITAVSVLVKTEIRRKRPPFRWILNAYITGIRMDGLAELDLPEGIQLATIAPYVVRLPPVTSLVTFGFRDSLLNHLTKTRQFLHEKKTEMEAIITRLSSQMRSSLFTNPTSTSDARLFQRCRVLYSLHDEAESVYRSEKQRISTALLTTIDQLLLFCEFAIDRHVPFLIVPPPADVDVFLAQATYSSWRRVLAFRVALNAAATKLRLVTARPETVPFVRHCLTLAKAGRKAETAYFEEIADEPRLHAFLSSPFSPIAAVPPPEQTPDAVGRWVAQSQALLSQWLCLTEPEPCLAVFLIRFFFQTKFPAFGPAPSLTTRLSAERERIRGLTCRAALLAERCVPDDFLNTSVKDLFQSSTVARAPLDWLQIVPFQTSPLDCAYAIFKVHEALTKMAALHAAQKRGVANPQEFFEGMPGFDDIFGHWVALLAVSDLPDPKAVVEFVTRWSKLPSFPQRFVACCTYLEASVRQIETSDGVVEEEQEETGG